MKSVFGNGTGLDGMCKVKTMAVFELVTREKRRKMAVFFYRAAGRGM